MSAIEDAADALADAAEKFVFKVECGLAHSRNSYPEFKAALRLYYEAQKEAHAAENTSPGTADET